MRDERFDRRVKSWWRAAEDHVMTPLEDTVDVDTQPIPVEPGFLDLDAPGREPFRVMVERRSPESVLLEIMRALEEDH